jgi:hypothetical protein
VVPLFADDVFPPNNGLLLASRNLYLQINLHAKRFSDRSRAFERKKAKSRKQKSLGSPNYITKSSNFQAFKLHSGARVTIHNGILQVLGYHNSRAMVANTQWTLAMAVKLQGQADCPIASQDPEPSTSAFV